MAQTGRKLLSNEVNPTSKNTLSQPLINKNFRQIQPVNLHDTLLKINIIEKLNSVAKKYFNIQDNTKIFT